MEKRVAWTSRWRYSNPFSPRHVRPPAYLDRRDGRQPARERNARASVSNGHPILPKRITTSKRRVPCSRSPALHLHITSKCQFVMHQFVKLPSDSRRPPSFDFADSTQSIILGATNARIAIMLGYERQGEQSGRTETGCRGIP